MAVEFRTPMLHTCLEIPYDGVRTALGRGEGAARSVAGF